MSRAQDLAAHFGSRVSAHGWDEAQDLVSDAGLIVNTTSLGMSGHDEHEPFPLDLGRALRKAVATDIVYVPLKTPFLKKAEEAGLTTVDGLGMLLHQAVPGFERWFGQRPQVTKALREHILADMAKAGALVSESKASGRRENGDFGTDSMIVLGLTGSIGMGKTTAANMFAEAGVPIYSADDTVHRLYSGRAAPLIEAAFPGTVENGAVDREKLSAAVIGKPEALKNWKPLFIRLCVRKRKPFAAARKKPAPLWR